jgi:hypothetical protein
LINSHGGTQQIKSEGFNVPEYDKNGKLSSLIKGHNAIILDREAILENVTVDIYNKDSLLILKTPHCKYKRTEKICTSKSPVKITGKGVKITGIGFDIDNNSKRIIIRNNVTIVWKQVPTNKRKNKQKPIKETHSTQTKGIEIPKITTEK